MGLGTPDSQCAQLRLSENVRKSQFPKLFVYGKLQIKLSFVCRKEAA